MPYALTNARIFTGDEWLDDTAVLVEADTIFAVGNRFPDELEQIDCQNLRLVPAFIDLQIYGGGGRLFNSHPTTDTIRRTYDEIRRSGTLHFQITLSTLPLETVWQGFDAARAYQASGQPGLLGVHLEGPYFHPAKRGAHVAAFLRRPETAELADLLERGQGALTYLTFAPELFTDEHLELLRQSGIQLSAGHSNATYAEAQRGFARGIGRVTHLFNAMSPLQHREPGLVGAAVESEALVSIVADGIHVDWPAVRIAKKLLGERLFFITDAVTEDVSGEYKFTFAGDRFVDAAGTLSGSALTMLQAVRNGVERAGFSLDEALRMASTYPARAAGLAQRLGRIAPGFAASLVLLDDELAVRGIVEAGELTWFAD